MADGEPSDHQAVQEAVARFLSDNLEDYRRRAAELQRLHRDLRYLTEVVAGTLKSVTDEQVEQASAPNVPSPRSSSTSVREVRAPGGVGPGRFRD